MLPERTELLPNFPLKTPPDAILLLKIAPLATSPEWTTPSASVPEVTEPLDSLYNPIPPLAIMLL